MTTFNEWISLNLSATAMHDWRFETGSGNFVDTTGGNNLAQNGDPVYLADGDVTTETDKAVEFDGDDFGRITSLSDFNAGQAVGSIILTVRPATLVGSPVVFGYGNPGGANAMYFQLIDDGADAKIVRFGWANSFGVKSILSDAVGIADANLAVNTYHMIVITQDGGGGGALIYLNGVLQTMDYTIVGAATKDEWWDSMEAITDVNRLVCCLFPDSGQSSNFFTGRIARMITTQTVMTAAQVTTLQALRSATLATGLTRRANRRMLDIVTT